MFFVILCFLSYAIYVQALFTRDIQRTTFRCIYKKKKELGAFVYSLTVSRTRLVDVSELHPIRINEVRPKFISYCCQGFVAQNKTQNLDAVKMLSNQYTIPFPSVSPFLGSRVVSVAKKFFF